MEHPGQFLRSDLVHHADGNSCGAGGAELVRSCHALLTEKISRSEQRNRGFLAVFGNNREFSPARLEIKQAVGTVSLRREDLIRLDANDCSSRARSREIHFRIKASRTSFGHD